MNPMDLTSSELLVWGIVLHLVADWPLQNHWMANNKQSLRHPAAYVHAGIHCLLLSIIFGWVAFPLAVVHLLIDTRIPLIWWGKVYMQTQPEGEYLSLPSRNDRTAVNHFYLWDVGTEVRFWTDQVFHIACIAVAALLIA